MEDDNDNGHPMMVTTTMMMIILEYIDKVVDGAGARHSLWPKDAVGLYNMRLVSLSSSSFYPPSSPFCGGGGGARA